MSEKKFDGKEIEEVLPVEMEEIEDASLEEAVYSKWTKEYKEARKSFYGSALEEPDEARGVWLYEQEAEKGNVLALFDLAEIYKNGNTEEKREKCCVLSKSCEGVEGISGKGKFNESSKRNDFI